MVVAADLGPNQLRHLNHTVQNAMPLIPNQNSGEVAYLGVEVLDINAKDKRYRRTVSASDAVA